MTEIFLCTAIDGSDKLEMINLQGDVPGRVMIDVASNIIPGDEIALRSPQLYSGSSCQVPFPKSLPQPDSLHDRARKCETRKNK